MSEMSPLKKNKFFQILCKTGDNIGLFLIERHDIILYAFSDRKNAFICIERLHPKRVN